MFEDDVSDPVLVFKDDVSDPVLVFKDDVSDPVIVFKDDVTDPVLVFKDDVCDPVLVFEVDVSDPELVFEDDVSELVIVFEDDFVSGVATSIFIIQTSLISSKSKLASQEYELFFIEHFMVESAGTIMSSLVHSALHVVPGSYLETIMFIYESTTINNFTRKHLYVCQFEILYHKPIYHPSNGETQSSLSHHCCSHSILLMLTSQCSNPRPLHHLYTNHLK